MKALSVRYEVVKSDGNWGNTRVGVEVQVEEGETAQQVLEKARAFVAMNMPNPERKQRVNQAQFILTHQDDYTGRQVQEAREFLEQTGADEDIPF